MFDVTTNSVIFDEPSAIGGGHAHPNQSTTSCSSVFFEGTAADFFGLDPLPPNVAADDIVRAGITVQAILKL